MLRMKNAIHTGAGRERGHFEQRVEREVEAQHQRDHLIGLRGQRTPAALAAAAAASREGQQAARGVGREVRLVDGEQDDVGDDRDGGDEVVRVGLEHRQRMPAQARKARCWFVVSVRGCLYVARFCDLIRRVSVKRKRSCTLSNVWIVRNYNWNAPLQRARGVANELVTK